MTERNPDLIEAGPFKITKRSEETDGEYMRAEATLHPSPDGAQNESDLPHHRWAADNVDEHLHPNQEEVLKVLSGEYQVNIDGTEHTLTEGDEISVPMNTPHKHWNPTDQPIRTVVERHPARDTETFFETLFTLAQAGKTGDDGLPNFLQFAVIQDAYPGDSYIADLPISVQKALFKLLAPIGRLAGYEPRYSRDEIDGLR